MDETGITDYSKAEQLLQEFGSVRNAVDHYQGL